MTPRLRFDDDGIEVEGGLLWLDATVPKPFGVISHAHGDHVARHRKILATPETAALVRKRSGHNATYIERRYGETIPVGDLHVTLLSAGHILGSAMVLIEGPGGKVLYSGDAKPDGGLTCPPAAPVPADVYITEATFGRPDYRFPPAAETRAALVAFARAALEAGETPVFLAYALGKGQEVMTALSRAGIPVAAHGAVWNLCSVYRSFGITWPGSRRLGKPGARRAAIVVPPRFLKTSEVQRAAPLKVAALTGWGERAKGPRVDAVFPLSDHADYDGLIELVERVRPKKTYVVHGYAEEFAADLTARGYEAEAVPGHSGPPDDGSRPGMFALS